MPWFLQQHNCRVDLKEGVLHIATEQVPLQQPRTSKPTCCRSTPITLPLNSEVIVPAKVETQWTRWAVFQCGGTETVLTHRGILVGRILVYLERGDIPVWMINPVPAATAYSERNSTCYLLCRQLWNQSKVMWVYLILCQPMWGCCMREQHPNPTSFHPKDNSCIPSYLTMPIFSPRGRKIWDKLSPSSTTSMLAMHSHWGKHQEDYYLPSEKKPRRLMEVWHNKNRTTVLGPLPWCS